MRQLTLQLELQARPVTGTLEYEDGSHDDFAGWLGLLSILETMSPTLEPSSRPLTTSPDPGLSSSRHMP
jgi:hypothetical protein